MKQLFLHFHVKKQANISFVTTENDYFLEMCATKSKTVLKMELKIRTAYFTGYKQKANKKILQNGK